MTDSPSSGDSGAAEHVGARRLVAGEEDLQGRGVERGRRRQLADRVLGNQPEGVGGVAELHVEVDEGDRSVDVAGEGGGEVGRHHRLAGSALGGEHDDDPRRLGGGGGADGPLSRRRRAVHSRARPSAGSSSTSTRSRIDDVAHPGPDRIAPEIVRRGGHQHDGHLGAVVAVGDRRHLDGEVQGNVVADAHDGCGLGADLAHDALGVERLAVAPRLEVQRTIGAGHATGPGRPARGSR